MLGKLFSTSHGNRIIIAVAGLAGLLTVTLIDSARTGTIVFLVVTAIESGVFSLIYGLRSDWRNEPAARAVFWIVLAYFGVAAHLVTMYAWPIRFWWTDDLREFLYLGLALAGLNLVLVLTRVLGRRVYRSTSRTT